MPIINWVEFFWISHPWRSGFYEEEKIANNFNVLLTQTKSQTKLKWDLLHEWTVFVFFTRGNDKKMNLPDNRVFKTIFSKGICSINFKFPGKIVQHVHKKRVLGIYFISQNISPKRHFLHNNPKYFSLIPKMFL